MFTKNMLYRVNIEKYSTQPYHIGSVMNTKHITNHMQPTQPTQELIQSHDWKLTPLWSLQNASFVSTYTELR